MLADCLTKTMTSGRLNETRDLRVSLTRDLLRGVSPSKPNTESGERRRKSKNDRKILILELLMLAVIRERFRSCEAAEYLKRAVCRLMLRVLSPSTGSESLKLRQVFSVKLAPRLTGVTSFTCVICYSVSTALAYTSAGPLSLKQNGVFTLVITSGYTDPHTAHSTHIRSKAGCCSFLLIRSTHRADEEELA